LPKGIAQLRSGHRGFGPAWAKVHRQFDDKIVAAAHNSSIRNFILRDQFQIALPPQSNAIILAHKVGIGPVGVRPKAKSERPPQAAFMHRQGRDNA
jgi:hypothetical protein